MATKRRYVVQLPTPVRQSAGFSLEDVIAGLPAAQIGSLGDSGIRVLALTQAEIAHVVHGYPGLLIEDDQELELLASMPALGFKVEPAGAHGLTFVVTDAETQRPIPGVTLFVQGEHATYRGLTDRDGRAAVTAFEPVIVCAIASPAAGYWSRVVEPATEEEEIAVALAPLAAQGAGGWPRDLLGLTPELPFRGAGVKVALIDSGIAEHADLALAGGFSTFPEGDEQDFARDEKGHGTHCAGIVAGRGGEQGVLGVAPDVDLYSIKAFPEGRLSNLLAGLQWAIDNAMDVVCLNVGLRAPSAQLALKIAEAVHRGIVIVAAAGNDGGALTHPAAADGVLAVSALGHAQSFPADSAHALRVGEMYNPETGLFVANFANAGPQTAFIAPGVAIVSSVADGYAAWDGTSMAAAFVTGLAALVLSAYPQLRTGDVRQAQSVHEILAASAVDLGLPAAVQGAGVPRADAALGHALAQRRAAEALALAQQQGLDSLEPLIADLEQKQGEIKSLLAQLV